MLALVEILTLVGNRFCPIKMPPDFFKLNMAYSLF